MQFGIFTVSDITTDPTTGRTPTEAERIKDVVTIAKHAEEVCLDVFALGVDSLAMMQMILRIEERFGVELSFKDIFDAPTVAALALRVGSARKNSADIMPSSGDPPTEIAWTKEDSPQPLSIEQERMLRIDLW